MTFTEYYTRKHGRPPLSRHEFMNTYIPDTGKFLYDLFETMVEFLDEVAKKE